MENIYVHIHVGWNGGTNNPGFRTFCGERNLQDLISMRCESGYLFEQDRDEKGRFSKRYYTGCNGNVLVDCVEATQHTGSIDFDGDYDSDYVYNIEDLDYGDTFRVIASSEYKSYELNQYLREWLLDGMNHNDSEIMAFLESHAELVRGRGYLTTGELVHVGVIDEE